MKRYGVMFLFSAIVAAPLATGQPGGAPRAGSEPKVDSVDPRAMYEDIEIMRRLLLRNIGGRSTVFRLAQCTTCHSSNMAYFDFGDADAGNGTPRSAVFLNEVTKHTGAVFADVDFDGFANVYLSQVAHPHGGGETFALEGSYLRGYGVVYNLTLPATAREELAASAAPRAAKVDSEWEQTRRQVRGEGPAQTPAKKPTLVDVLLQVLSDNGKNFKHLSADEKLTIVVTFRGGPAIPAGTWHNGKLTPTTSAGTVSSRPPLNADGGAAAGVESAEPLMPDREFELLADLHVKRGNLNDALAAFDRALTQASEAVIRAGDATAMERAKSRVRDLSRKLAETHLKMNNFDGARKALEAGEAAMKSNAPKPGDKKPEPTSVALPGKLIVSVPKRALDLAGTHAMPPEEFRKHVSIETPSFERK